MNFNFIAITSIIVSQVSLDINLLDVFGRGGRLEAWAVEFDCEKNYLNFVNTGQL